MCGMPYFFVLVLGRRREAGQHVQQIVGPGDSFSETTRTGFTLRRHVRNDSRRSSSVSKFKKINQVAWLPTDYAVVSIGFRIIARVQQASLRASSTSNFAKACMASLPVSSVTRPCLDASGDAICEKTHMDRMNEGYTVM